MAFYLEEDDYLHDEDFTEEMFAQLCSGDNIQNNDKNNITPRAPVSEVASSSALASSNVIETDNSNSRPRSNLMDLAELDDAIKHMQAEADAEKARNQTSSQVQEMSIQMLRSAILDGSITIQEVHDEMNRRLQTYKPALGELVFDKLMDMEDLEVKNIEGVRWNIIEEAKFLCFLKWQMFNDWVEDEWDVVPHDDQKDAEWDMVDADEHKEVKEKCEATC